MYVPEIWHELHVSQSTLGSTIAPDNSSRGLDNAHDALQFLPEW